MQATGTGHKACIIGQLRALDGVAQGAPELVPIGVDDDMDILGLKSPNRHSGNVPRPCRHRNFPGDEVVHRTVDEQGDLRVQERHIDTAALAGVLALVECGQHPMRGEDAASHIAYGGAHAHGLPAERTGIAHDAAQGLHHQVKGRAIFAWPCVAVARDGTRNNPRVDLLERLIVDAQALQDTGTKVIVDDVRPPHQLVEDLQASRALQVQGHALLTAVHAQEIAALSVHEMRRHVPAAIALAGDFDLQHFGPQITQNHAAVGTG